MFLQNNIKAITSVNKPKMNKVIEIIIIINDCSNAKTLFNMSNRPAINNKICEKRSCFIVTFYLPTGLSFQVQVLGLDI
ncbi:hypothetical protein GCM10007203_23410 [Staphylococcus nepalensis]|nr:hypothetical protein GCM10007203_23410 [Staphylococcus nepalensis]